MKQLLEKFKQEKKVVSVYNDSSDTGNCWTGFVYEVDDDYVLIAHVSENGFSYIKKEDIHQLFIDSLPEQNLALLYNDLNK